VDQGSLATDADAALRCSVEIARRATANSNTRVAASIGPYGAILHDGSEYRGDYGVNREALYRFHAERIAILNEAAPDLLLAETIPDFVETQALARALGEVDRPIGFSFNSSDGTTLCSGASLVEAIETIQGIPHLEFIGFNCVAPEIVSDLVTAARAISSTPIAIYPNKGGLWDPHTGNWSDQGTRPLEDWWREWSMLGIEYIGGCCGTDAETISTLRHHLDSGDSKNSSSI
jgi:homocysteine S-methyltransferase